jgi:catechol 2,3-dioxygenase-like lactoylglutathione lyase family enzyme
MKNKLWFRRKTYGWGWTPITWEGWAISIGAIALPLLIRLVTKLIGLEKPAQYFYTYSSIPLIFMGLTLICFRYGEKPRWQWGIKRTKLSHVEINVANYIKSIQFYDLILISLGWEKLVSRKDHTTYTDGTLKLIFCPVEETHKSAGYHRKRIGLNHFAFYVETKEMVDEFCREILQKNNIATLYHPEPKGDNNYYSVLFEDPDRIKLEVVYSPFYCDKENPFNNLDSDFDPYQS